MTMNEKDGPWEVRTLGDLSPEEHTKFYEDLIEDEPEDHFTHKWKKPELYEDGGLKVGIMLDDGTIVPAENHRDTEELHDTHIDVYLERYFTQAMPAKRFDLQLAISSYHKFDNHEKPESISHTLAVSGILGKYVNYLGEPVFKKLKISNSLTLHTEVNFLANRDTQKLIDFLKGSKLRTGIQLVSVYNPVFGIISNYVRGLVETLAETKKNQSITNAQFTLETSPGRLSLPLIEGTYVLFQPTTETEDSMTRRPRYDFDRQRIVLEDADFERNHMILRIKKHE